MKEKYVMDIICDTISEEAIKTEEFKKIFMEIGLIRMAEICLNWRNQR